ncbi:MAG TPA: hypothetical protein VGY77_06265, partial [Gemmataceae bacterium]|nr:hypothetical protein [Gemmataceae bacterium]
MNSTLITVLTFVAAGLVVLGLYSIVFDLFLRNRERVSQRLQDEFSKKQRNQIQRSSLFKNLTQAFSESLPEEKISQTLNQRLVTLIEQSGLDLPVGRLVAIMAIVGLALGSATGFLTKFWYVGVGAGVVGTALPLLFLQLKRRRRQDKLL